MVQLTSNLPTPTTNSYMKVVANLSFTMSVALPYWSAFGWV